jgi:CheY-like chemotaxis protein
VAFIGIDLQLWHGRLCWIGILVSAFFLADQGTKEKPVLLLAEPVSTLMYRGSPPGPLVPHLKVAMQKRILIVDDSDSTRGLVREFLESRPDFEVCGEAVDGLEGIEKGRELNPDLIVLDYSLPRINGLQVAVILHVLVPNTPIILFTFYKDVIPIRMAHEAGIAAIVSKSDQLTILADEVQRLTGWKN